MSILRRTWRNPDEVSGEKNRMENEIYPQKWQASQEQLAKGKPTQILKEGRPVENTLRGKGIGWKEAKIHAKNQKKNGGLLASLHNLVEEDGSEKEMSVSCKFILGTFYNKLIYRVKLHASM
jgi:hypothetical protein